MNFGKGISYRILALYPTILTLFDSERGRDRYCIVTCILLAIIFSAAETGVLLFSLKILRRHIPSEEPYCSRSFFLFFLAFSCY